LAVTFILAFQLAALIGYENTQTIESELFHANARKIHAKHFYALLKNF